MSELNVQIVKLEPFRVISAYGFGEGPEGIAWTKMFNWIEANGLAESIAAQRFFGFNNPNPSPGSPNYGYEQWMVVDESVVEGGELAFKKFEGGLYGVAKCVGIQNIGAVWQQLFAWREYSPYKPANHQWLEEWANPVFGFPMKFESMVMQLYLPISG